MLAVQLENGKTVFKTFQEWIDMTPEQYQEMIARDEGFEIDNPFDHTLDRIKDDTVWDIPDTIDETVLQELQDLESKNKLNVSRKAKKEKD